MCVNMDTDLFLQDDGVTIKNRLRSLGPEVLRFADRDPLFKLGSVLKCVNICVTPIFGVHSLSNFKPLLK